jgi:hypothetical protein
MERLAGRTEACSYDGKGEVQAPEPLSVLERHHVVEGHKDGTRTQVGHDLKPLRVLRTGCVERVIGGGQIPPGP